MEQFDVGAFTGHSVASAAIIGAAFGWFTPLAAFAAFVWYCIQIYSSKPVQDFLHNRRVRKVAQLKRELARLEASELVHRSRKSKDVSAD